MSKTRVKFYTDSHRGVHAATDIKLDDIILQIPKKDLLKVEDFWHVPLCVTMKEAGLLDDSKLYFGKHNFFAAYVMTEVYK